MNNRVQSVVLIGKTDYARMFLLESAIHLAERGDSVLYICPEQWQSLPAIFHDRERSDSDSLKRIKFMYLSNYDDLVDKLLDLDKFSMIPKVLIIDNLDNYSIINDSEESTESHIAKLCAIILYTMNNCAQVLKLDQIKFCCSTSMDEKKHILKIYFDDLWITSNDDDNNICISKIDDKNSSSNIFKFNKLEDSVLVLKEIVEKIV